MKNEFSISDTLSQISSSKFLSLLKPLFIQIFPSFFEIINRRNEKLVLQRFSSLEHVEVVSLPDEVVDLDGSKRKNNIRHFRGEIRKSLKIFEDVINNQVPCFDKILFYKNLEDLKVKRVDFIEPNIEALYIHDLNLLLLLSSTGFKHIYHELFHIASFKKRNGIISSGFMQFVENDRESLIGRGLTEGYTQILTERYFDNYNISKGIYLHLVHFVSHLEWIVGKEKMEAFYSKADLFHLIGELEQYNNRDNILKFLKNLDIIELILDRTRGAWEYKRECCDKALQEVVTFLLQCRSLQLRRELDLGHISESDLEVAIDSFMDSLCIDFINSYGDVYQILMSDEDYQMVDSVLYGIKGANGMSK